MPDTEKINIQKRNHTYLTGIYLAINAISDAYLIMDGPDCAYKKIESIEKSHDFYTNIFDKDGKHRICATNTNIKEIDQDRSEMIKGLIKKISSDESSGVVFISAEPMANLVGVQYDNLIEQIGKKDKPIINIPYSSIDKDWLDGFADTLEKIANNISLKKDSFKPKTIGIVGYMFDRYEGDHIGNLDEIRRWFSELSIEVSSIWPEGRTFDELKKIEEAEIIVSLPYARKTAKIISEKTGAKLLELDIPMGIENTKDWILEISDCLGIKQKAEIFIEKEMREALPILEWIVPRYFQGKTAMLGLDPYLGKSLMKSLKEIDVEITEMVFYSRKRREEKSENIKKNTDIFWETDDVLRTKHIDFAIGNTEFNEEFVKDIPSVELSYPCFNTHFFSKEPFMGIKGFVLLLNKIVNSRLYHES